MECGLKKVFLILALAAAPAAPVAEVQKIYDELRVKSEAEIAKFEKLGQGGE